MTNIKANPNFHILGGKNILAKSDPVFQEYRRKWKENPEKMLVEEFPLHLDIEATCSCNLRCPFCATNYEPIGGAGFMSFETFKKIIDEGVKHNLCAIKLNSGGRGEPLLNKELPEMIAYAKQKGIIDSYINTNAALLTKNVALRLILAGIDRISISFEGTTKKIYEKYRVGAKFETVVDNIKNFVKLRDELGFDKPKIRIQTVALPELKPHLKNYTEFWSDIADEVAFIDFKDYSQRQRHLVCNWACPYLWQRLMVRWDGTISACQFDYSNELKLGNVNDGDSIHDVWNGIFIEKLRELAKTGKLHEINICDGCGFRTTEIMKLKDAEATKTMKLRGTENDSEVKENDTSNINR